MAQENKKTELAVAALREGTVIDHIPCSALFSVVNILGICDLTTSVTIGFNLSSKRMQRKGIIKIADIRLPEDTLKRIALVAPNAVINIIEDYTVVAKHTVTLPTELVDIVRCSNPQCITNNEPMHSKIMVDADTHELHCHYCSNTMRISDAILK